MCSAHSLDAMWTIKSTTRLLYPYSLSYLWAETETLSGLDLSLAFPPPAIFLLPSIFSK